MTSDFGCYNIADLRRQARRRLPLGIWEYLERGAEDESGMARNRAAFEKMTLTPRVLRNVEGVDTGAQILGRHAAAPFAIAPTGAAGLVWHKGDEHLARAAAAAGIPFTISSASTQDIGDIWSAGENPWFQLYLWEDRSLSFAVLDTAIALGCDTLFVTLDMPVPPNREYIHRNGFGTPFRLNARNFLDILAHPRWLAGVMGRYALNGGVPSQANLPDRLRSKLTAAAMPGALFKQDNLDWDGLAEIRRHWPGKLVLKGVLHPADAELAANAGVDAIVVSNHGARALDSSPASMAALPPIVDAIGADLEILLDSGIRRGSDILKAIALGASAVLVGRAPLYGLAVAGEAGVSRALTILQTELSRTMAMLGLTDISQIGPEVFGALP